MQEFLGFIMNLLNQIKDLVFKILDQSKEDEEK